MVFPGISFTQLLIEHLLCAWHWQKQSTRQTRPWLWVKDNTTDKYADLRIHPEPPTCPHGNHLLAAAVISVKMVLCHQLRSRLNSQLRVTSPLEEYSAQWSRVRISERLWVPVPAAPLPMWPELLRAACPPLSKEDIIAPT